MGRSVKVTRSVTTRTYKSITTRPKVSAYSIYDGQTISHGIDEDDLIATPNTFLELSDLAPGECSPLSVAIIQAAACVGPTALVLPYAFLLGGLLPTLILLPIFAFVACALRLRLVQLGISHGIFSLHGLATQAFGLKGAMASGILQLTVSTGLVATYFVILFRDLPLLLVEALHPTLNGDDTGRVPVISWLLDNHIRFAEIMTAGVVIPFCLVWSSHSKLKGACVVVFLALCVACFFVLANAPALHKRDVPLFAKGFTEDYLALHLAVCHSIGILSTSFASPHHTFHTFYALRGRSIGLFALVSIGSTLISIFWALGFGVGGYLSFLSDTRADVLQNYLEAEDDTPLYMVWVFWVMIPFCAIVCIALEVVVSRHTINFFVQARESLRQENEDVLFWSQIISRRTSPTFKPGPRMGHSQPEFSWKNSVITVGVVLALAQIAILTEYSAATTMGITGAVGGLALLFILPAACHLKLTIGDDDEDRGGWILMRLFPTLSIMAGVIGIIFCTIIAGIKAIV